MGDSFEFQVFSGAAEKSGGDLFRGGGFMLGTIIADLRFLVLGVCALLFVSCSKQTFTNPDQSQEFQQEVKFNNKVDILIMSDDTTSMSVHQQKLMNQVPAMLNSLNSSGMDYQIGVTGCSFQTGGSGGQLKGSPKFLSKNSPNLTTDLQNRIYAVTNLNIEEGLWSVMKVLSPSYLAKEGAGFIRDDALLAILFLTNEDDYSTQSPQQFIDAVDSLKRPFASGAPSWVANYIGILSIDESCVSLNPGVEVGTRYLQVVDHTGGIKGTLCKADFAEAVTNVRVKISQLLTDYYLNRKPVESSIVVYVNGKVVLQNATNGWSYHSDGNFIRFNGSSVPLGQDSIKVDFTPAEAG